MHEEHSSNLSDKGAALQELSLRRLLKTLLQELMIKRELAKDPKLANESWDRFLPKFRQRHLKTSEKTARKNEKLTEKNGARKAAGLDPIQITKKEKKVYTPFPPPQQPRKVINSWIILFG